MAEGNAAWWGASALAVAPAVGLAAAGGLLGLGGPGLGAGLAAGAAAWFVFDLAVLQPKIDRGLLGAGDPLGHQARELLTRALSSRTVGEVGMHLADTVRQAIGSPRAILIVPAPGGGVQVLGGEGNENVGDAELAFEWLGVQGAPFDRAGLAQMSADEGARAVDALLARLDADAILPLRHRGLLLGVAVLDAPKRRIAGVDLERFYRAIGAFTTVAVANTYLDVEARGKGGLAKAFDLATALQEALMPDDRPIKRSGVSIRGLYRPVAECGGDLWLSQELGKGRVLLMVADATGHGAAPAMLTAVAKGGVEAMRHVAGADLEPAALLTALNRSVWRAGRTRYFMTAFACIVDAPRGEVRFANAGQNFPYVVTRDADGRPRVEALVARGNTLGSAGDAKFENHTRKLGVGERLVLFTDGIVDAGSPLVEPFGEKRFRAALAAHADTPAARLADALVAEVDAFLAGRPVADDLTVVTAEILPADEGGSR